VGFSPLHLCAVAAAILLLEASVSALISASSGAHFTPESSQIGELNIDPVNLQNRNMLGLHTRPTTR